MKSAALLFAVIAIALMLPAMLLSIDDFRLNEQEDPFNVTTGAGTTSQGVGLSQSLFGNDTIHASVSSNLTTDAPIAYSYTSANQTLLVTGLTASASRRLTITYDIDALGDYWGAGTATRVWPLLLIFGGLAVIVAAVYVALESRKGG